MEVKFNINQRVKVKLTEHGISLLKERRRKLNERIVNRGGKGFGDVEIVTDENGYTSYQMWELMNIFGATLSMGFENPFETEIIICLPNT